MQRATINDFSIQSDGKIVYVISANSSSGIFRLLPNGNSDSSFVTPNVGGSVGSQVRVLSNGQIILTNNFSFSKIYRFNSDGSLDETIITPRSIGNIRNYIVDAAGKIWLYGSNGTQVKYGYLRLNIDGSIDTSFNVKVGIAGSVSTMAVQTNGKVIVVGQFNSINGVFHNRIARINVDGSLDTTFNSGTGFKSGSSIKILVQSDGKILVVGFFIDYNGIQGPIVRLNSDGSLDSTFKLITPQNQSPFYIHSVAQQSDGKIIIGGSFSSIGGVNRTGLARLNSDGSLDTTFNTVFESNSGVNNVVVQGDGKIMISGSFNEVNGLNRKSLARLNSNGSVDTSFNSTFTTEVSGFVRQIEFLPDGKYMILTYQLTRLNSNGTYDNTFQSPTFSDTNNSEPVSTFLVQPDGSVIVGGGFRRASSGNGDKEVTRLARLKPDGTLDTSFFPNGANNQVRVIVRQADDKIIIGGDFSEIENVTRVGIARLIVSPMRAPTTPYDFDGDGRADVAVFRPSNGNWFILPSRNNAFYGFPFGQAGDRIAPADYDGDGKTDVAVFRDVVPGAGNSAYFYILNSSDNSFRPVQFGATGDVPMAGDWDGDGKGDIAVYRDGSKTGGQSYFYYRSSSQPSVNFNTIPLGATGDKPLLGDFDGDGRLDPAVFRPSNATWYILRSSINQITQTAFGASTDIPVPADYDGDGRANIAVFRPSNGTWYTSTNAAINFGAVQFGANGDLPVPADYDGDGRADVAVFRPSNGAWYLNRSTQGLAGVAFGSAEDKPIPNAYIP
jgi:uncharacterized delta-60 repeat protein